jgi:hypothetical protein
VAQLTIYLDKDTQAKARRAARQAGQSLSGWARAQLSAAADSGKEWPNRYFSLFGSIDDSGFAAPAPLPPGAESKREAL